MSRDLIEVDEVIAKANALFDRYDQAPGSRAAERRSRGRSTAAIARRLASVGMAIGALIIATIAFGLFIQPIGVEGLFIVAVAMLGILIFSSMKSIEPAPQKFSEEMPTRRIIQQLESYLVRRRGALPREAARQVDAISAQLPMLEAKLADADPLDPLAQDARRLMGRHLPDLIDHYERVPAAYRGERDGEGKTVDDRLTDGLDAAAAKLKEVNDRIARADLDAFETQGRFIESRYKEKDGIDGG